MYFYKILKTNILVPIFLTVFCLRFFSFFFPWNFFFFFPKEAVHHLPHRSFTYDQNIENQSSLFQESEQSKLLVAVDYLCLVLKNQLKAHREMNQIFLLHFTTTGKGKIIWFCLGFFVDGETVWLSDHSSFLKIYRFKIMNV